MKTRPLDELLNSLDDFKSSINKIIGDDKQFDLKLFTKIGRQFVKVVEQYELERDFPISDQTFNKLKEKQANIEAAVIKYKDDLAKYELKKAVLEKDIAKINSDIEISQGDAGVNLLEKVVDIEYLQGEVKNQIDHINRNLKNESCWFRLFSCCASSAAVAERERLDELEFDYAKLKNKDPNTSIKYARLELDKKLKDKDAELTSLIHLRPTEEDIRAHQAELDNLNSDIVAERLHFYRNVSIQTMTQLIRMRVFIQGAEKKLSRAKDQAERSGSDFLGDLYGRMLGIVKSFAKLFNQLCDKFVCRMEDNEAIEVKYSDYCERFDNLKNQQGANDEEAKQLIIKGDNNPATFDVIKRVFVEHYAPEVQDDAIITAAPALAPQV